MCGIYKITNLVNGKSYIGQSINIEERWKRHKQARDDFAIHQAFKKYGLDSFSFEVIEECDPSLLDEREQFWIQYFDSFKKGYNMNEGGSNHVGQDKGKKVYQYSLSGELLATYKSALEAHRQTGIDHASICNCCRKQQSHCGGYIWRYEEEIPDLAVNLKNTQRPIYQFSKEGILIQSYSSLAEAALKTGINKVGICNVCKKKAKTAGGYLWSYEPTIEQLDYAYKKQGVIQLSLQNKEINHYKSISEASQVTGVGISSISSACSGRYKTAGGYKWKFE